MRKSTIICGALAATILLSCATVQSRRSTFNQAAADRALLEFGQKHEQCQLWTNWQKLCSRRNDGRATCILDTDHPVAPSAPFCAEYDTFNAALVGPMDEVTSKARFCETTEQRQLVDGQGRPGGKVMVCTKFRTARPFNGRDFQQMKSPLCASWKRGLGDAWYCSKWNDTTCKPKDGSGRSSPNPEVITIPRLIHPDKLAVLGVACAVRGSQDAR